MLEFVNTIMFRIELIIKYVIDYFYSLQIVCVYIVVNECYYNTSTVISVLLK
jgi:hypothetical protein